MYGYVYITTNLINGMKYIGQHRSSEFTDQYKGSGKYLWNAINKYGWDNFKVELIEECVDQESLNDRENYWIEYYDAVNSSEYYNLISGTFQVSCEDLLDARRRVFNGDAAPWFRTEKCSENRVKALHDKYGRDTVFDNSDEDLKKKQMDSRRSKYGDPAFNLHTPESFDKARQTMMDQYGVSKFTDQLNTPEAQEKKRVTQSYLLEFDGKEFIGIHELSEYIRHNYYPTISNSTVKRIALEGLVSKKYESVCNGRIIVLQDRFTQK